MLKPFRKRKVKNILSGLSGIITSWIVWLLLEKPGKRLEGGVLEPDPVLEQKYCYLCRALLLQATPVSRWTMLSSRGLLNIQPRFRWCIRLWRGLAACWVSGSVSAPYKMRTACRFRATLKKSPGEGSTWQPTHSVFLRLTQPVLPLELKPIAISLSTR